jgi:dipeptidyl aminopeptidase/acylaminoacyl peptidase
MQRSLPCSIALISAVTLAVPAFAAKRAFTLPDLYRVQSISDVRLSPDGQRIVYLVTTSDLARATQVKHLWMAEADGSNPRQLTFDEKGESDPALSPDGRRLAFVSSRGGDANLWVLPMDGGEARRLTSISTGVSGPLWSPDGRWIAFETEVYPECGADDACNKKVAETWHKGPLAAHMADRLLYRHWTEWKDGKRSHVFVADAETGTVRDLTPGDFDSPAFQLGGPLQYDFSPDSRELAWSSNHDPDPASSTNNDLFVVSLTDASAAPVDITAANPAYDGTPRYSPDGRTIAYRMQKLPGYESDLFRLALYDRASGKSSVLTESFQNWVDDFQWSHDGGSVFFTGPDQGENPIYRLDLATGAIAEILRDKTIDAFAVDKAGQSIVYIRRAVGAPWEIYAAALGDTGAPRITRLSHVNDAVADEVDIRPAETMWVEGALGARIECFVVKPHRFDASNKYPLILNVHGGPQQQWADAFRGDWQVYPGAGYVVAFCNPHGSTGYGQAFTAEISGDWGGAVFQDLMKATDALAKLPYVDADRMGAMGWSYGGYMMDWFEGHTTRFRALASMMGVYDLRSMYGATEELWFPEWDLKGQPWNSPLYEKWSSSNFVKSFKTPCLVITGEKDFRVPYTQSLQLFTDLQKMKVPSRLIVFSKAGHWPSWYEMALYYTAHLEWFQQYLGGEAPPWTTREFLRNQVFDPKTGKPLTPEQKAELRGSSPPESGDR